MPKAMTKKNEEKQAKKLMCNPPWGVPVRPSKRGTICHECKMDKLLKNLRVAARAGVEEYNDQVPEGAVEEAQYPPTLVKVVQVMEDMGTITIDPDSDDFKIDPHLVADALDGIDVEQFHSWKDVEDLFNEPEELPKISTILTGKYRYVNIGAHEAKTRHDRNAFNPNQFEE